VLLTTKLVEAPTRTKLASRSTLIVLVIGATISEKSPKTGQAENPAWSKAKKRRWQPPRQAKVR
jgi:hypothetical protein